MLGDADWSEAEPDRPVQVRLQALVNQKGRFAEATVLQDHYSSFLDQDVAYLLLPEPAPEEAQPLPLAAAEQATGHPVYAFPQRTFQEYPAACHSANFCNMPCWRHALRLRMSPIGNC